MYEEAPILEDVILVEPSQLDAIMVPPTDDLIPKDQGAGDLLPTFVTPDDAKRYLDQVNTGFVQLDVAVLASSVAMTFKSGWALEVAGWKAFYTGAIATLGWLNTKAVMDQADRYAQELIDWRKSFAAAGGNPPGPDPLPPGQGVPSGTSPSDFTKLAIAIGAAAAIVTFGPAIARSFR